MPITEENIILFAKEQQVFTDDEAVNKFAINKNERHNFITLLGQLCKSGRLHYYKDNIYGYVSFSTWFNTSSYLSEEDALTQLYIKNNEGYISGADFIYMIGLLTWLAAKKTVVANNVRKKEIGKTVTFLPPKTVITKDNKDYLQLLDCFENINEFAVDALNPYKLIRNYIEKKALNTQMLLGFAKKYYSKKILEALTICLE